MTTPSAWTPYILAAGTLILHGVISVVRSEATRRDLDRQREEIEKLRDEVIEQGQEIAELKGRSERRR